MIRLECSKIDPMNGTLVRHECSAGSIHRATRMQQTFEEDGYSVTMHRDPDLESAGKSCVQLFRDHFGGMPQCVAEAVTWARNCGLITEIEAGSLEYYFE